MRHKYVSRINKYKGAWLSLLKEKDFKFDLQSQDPTLFYTQERR